MPLTLCALLLLTACASTHGTATTGVASKVDEQKARCSGWRPLDYSVNGDPEKGETHGDTDQTIQEIREHNQTGVNKRCWKKAP